MLYLDEAGTSRHEPVTVVSGVVLHPDRDWRRTEDAIQQVFDQHVPRSLREGFRFHAKDVWNGSGARRLGSKDARTAFIGAMAAIPRSLGLAISVGKVRRDFSFQVDPTVVSLEGFHHLLAFRACVQRANKYVRDWGGPAEICTVVAEDVPEKKRFLKAMMEPGEMDIPAVEPDILLTLHERKIGKVLQTRAGPLDRLVDGVRFAAKDEAPLLQLADACAFVFRRYFAGQDMGEMWVKKMLGKPGLVWDDWQGPISESVFRFHNLP